ncbi:Serine proteinase stubble, partial [Armadillidium nasatum]
CQEKGGNLKSQCGHASYDCVPYFQCVDGVINTDGRGLIDVRILPQGVCSHPEYPDVPGVCCLIPGAPPTPPPVDACPAYLECVDYSLCSSNDQIITDGSGLIDRRTGHTSCRLPSGIGGICCAPPTPYIDTCPGKSVCKPKLECLGQALDAKNSFVDFLKASTALWTECSFGGERGICCIPPPPKVIDLCPGESVCVQPNECKGTALNDLEKFVDYSSQGSWTYCSAFDQGVCCINPYIKPDLEPASECGVRHYQIDKRITGKIDASFGEFPWQGIIFYQNYTFNCGASLVSNKHAITGAHCIHKLLASDIRLRFGEWQVNSFDEPLPYIDRNVYAIHIHPKFNSKNLHNDIAVIELLEPIDYQYHINSICIPSYGQIIDPYTLCVTTGWGKDSFHGSFQHILKKIEVPFIDHDTCQTYLRKTRLGKYFKLDESFVCAGGEENKDACYGDGGGPLACKSGSNYYLTGITSWGIGCGTKNIPGVYADVQSFSKWIEDIVRKPGSVKQVQEPNQKPGY